jgi:ElaB/YqjD/DUF883 family membrane-anchored ribosome-binding protein
MATSDLSEDLSNDVKKLKTDIDELRKDVASIARALKELGATKGREAFAEAEEVVEKARRRAAAAEERIGQEIEERPFASMLTAFGVGFVIGKLLGSDR